MKAIVVGGGLGGCAAAVGLLAAGHDVTVYEAAGTMREEGESISLFANGLAALGALGVQEHFGHRISRLTFLLRKTGRPATSVNMTAIERKTGYPYVLVPRCDVLEILAGRLGEQVIYGKRCVGVTSAPDGATIHFADGTEASSDLVVAADGSRSILRQSLWPEDQSQRFSMAWQGTVALPDDYPSPEEVFIVVGPGTVAGAFPTTEDRAIFVVEDRAGLDLPTENVKETLLERYGRWPRPIVSLVEAIAPDAIRADEVFISRPPRSWAKDRVFLLGDAAHSFSSSIGQGTNQAFEDAVALAQAAGAGSDLDQAGRRYTRSRHRRATLYWQYARLATQPALSRVNELNQRLTPSSVTTMSWHRVTRPSRQVRKLVESGSTRGLS